MPNEFLDEREFELVNIVGAKLGANQRDISRMMNLSLGMVNMLIQRLIAKGIIRITQLNKRKVQYLLTPKGFAEKMRKSVRYTLKTINSLDLIKNKIKDVVIPFYHQGERCFVVLGRSDFANLIEIVFRDLGLEGYTIKYINSISKDIPVDGILLICEENVKYSNGNGRLVINLIEELAQDHNFINHSYSAA